MHDNNRMLQPLSLILQSLFIRRLEEYERTSSVLTLRVEESYTQEACLIDYLHQLLSILNELRCHFEEIAKECDRDVDALE